MNPETPYMYTPAVKYQTYTKETMLAYLKTIDSFYEGWTRTEGVMEGSGRPWVAFEHPDGTWMHHWHLQDNGRLSKGQFNPNQRINLHET